MFNAPESPPRHLFMRCALGVALLSSACTDSELTDAQTPTDCLVVPSAGGFCDKGRCRLTVPPEAVEEATYLIFEERPVSGSLLEETVGGVTCFLGPPTIDFLAPASIRVRYTEDELTELITEDELRAFALTPQGGQDILEQMPRNLVDNEVEVRTESSIEVGITAVPQAIVATDELGEDSLEVTDDTSYFRNISSGDIEAAFFDGQRFYLGNGARVLIFNDGIPEEPTKLPDVIVGKPNLASRISTPGASNISGNITGLWSDGERLVVASGNRVLIWRSVPTEDFTPADLVLGQDGFSSDRPNGGRAPNASTLWQPDDIASDGTRLLVADASNHRVLVWDRFPVLNNQPADRVIGQGDFQDSAIRGGALPIYQSRGLYIDDENIIIGSSLACTCLYGLSESRGDNNPTPDFSIGEENVATRVGPLAFPRPAGMSGYGAGGFALRDAVGQRVSIWNTLPLASDVPPDIMLGKPDPTLAGGPLDLLNASSLSSGSRTAGLYADSQRLIVADGRRALIWNSLPEGSFAPADLVLGQPSFTTAEAGIDYRNINDNSLAHPSDIAQEGALIAIADRSNNRVLLIDSASMGAQGEVIVVGQSDAQSYAPNRDWRSPSAASLNGPTGVAFADGRLIIADSGNHRVLIYNRIPQQDGAQADLVLGQADFSAISANGGAGDADGDGALDTSASSMFYPSDVHVHEDTLFVADTFNHRILVFSPVPTSSGEAATAVYGQPDFSGNQPNEGAGWFSPTATGLAIPAGLTTTSSGTLVIADQENNRVLLVPAPYDGPPQRVLGQADLISDRAPNFVEPPASAQGIPVSNSRLIVNAQSLRRPRGVIEIEGVIIVSDTGNHRVLGYRSDDDSAAWLIGQETPDEGPVNAQGLGPGSLSSPAGLFVHEGRLLVADMNNHRVLAFARSGSMPPQPLAEQLFGQVDFLSNGINRSAGAAALLGAPSGVSFDGEMLWVTDRLNHRVLGFEGRRIAVVLGQIDLVHTQANAGETPSASSLNEPSDIASDGQRLIVADRNNHRVLIWNERPQIPGRPADVVIGQTNTASVGPNSSRGLFAVGADTLLTPEGVYLDGETLYIADTGNNRVLVFDRLPTNHGASADRVYCQPDMTSNLGNQGARAPNASSCSGPTDAKVVRDRLYIADALNNRVLAFMPGSTQAQLVLGQPDMSSRKASTEQGTINASTLSSPSSIEHDGDNLFIVDRGNHRVLVFESEPQSNGAPASLVFGQYTFLSSSSGNDMNILDTPHRIAVQRLPFHRTRVFVADGGKDRVVRFDGVPTE